MASPGSAKSGHLGGNLGQLLDIDITFGFYIFGSRFQFTAFSVSIRKCNDYLKATLFYGFSTTTLRLKTLHHVCGWFGLKQEYDTRSVVEENVEKFTMKINKAVVWTQNYPEWRDGVTTVNVHWRQSRHLHRALRQGTPNKHVSPTGLSTEIGNVLRKITLRYSGNIKKSEISFVRTNKRHDLQSITWPHENGASGLSHKFQLGGGTKCPAGHVQCGRWHSQKEMQAPYGSTKKKDLGHWSEENV